MKRSKKSEPKPEPPKSAVKVFPKNSPYDYLVFTKLVRFSGFMWFSFVIILPGTMCTGFLIPGFYLITIYALLIYAGLLVLYLLINQYRYHFIFKGWQERLLFRINGWNEMIHEKKMFCDLCWNDTRIEILLTNESAEILELTGAALKIFCENSRSAFYDKEMGTVSELNRNSWKLINQRTAEGSANPEVMRYMKNLFEGELTTIAKKTGAIKEVNVTLLSKEFQVEIAISSD